MAAMEVMVEEAEASSLELGQVDRSLQKQVMELVVCLEVVYSQVTVPEGCLVEDCSQV